MGCYTGTCRNELKASILVSQELSELCIFKKKRSAYEEVWLSLLVDKNTTRSKPFWCYTSLSALSSYQIDSTLQYICSVTDHKWHAFLAFQCNCSSFFRAQKGVKHNGDSSSPFVSQLKVSPTLSQMYPRITNAINAHHSKLGLNGLHVSMLTTTTSFPSSFFNSCNIQGHRGALMANIYWWKNYLDFSNIWYKILKFPVWFCFRC